MLGIVSLDMLVLNDVCCCYQELIVWCDLFEYLIG